MPIVKEKIDVSVKISPEIVGQTILHCRMLADEYTLIRIWPEAVLIDNNHVQYKLLFADNINIYPNWRIPTIKSGYACFTLIFEKLKANCSTFSLFENIPEPNGFFSQKIKVNNVGVYNVMVYS
jgi:hypothetical protein